jgi:alcohol dehydrogenase class IV
MKPFRHFTPASRVYYGPDSLRQLPAELERLNCSRAVVFCGQTLAQRSDGLGVVAEALGSRYGGVFDGVKAHSPLPAVTAGAELLRELDADAVIALGGGSAVVSARAATILLAEGRDIHALCTQYPPGKAPVSPKLVAPKLPQLVVPTAPTTAYAKAGTAVLDSTLHRRLTLFDPKTRAQALFIHPALVMTAPASLVLDAGLQAFAMAVQGIEAKSRDTLADALLMHALRVLSRQLRALAEDAQDFDTRGELMLGALLAGQGTDYAPSGVCSALAHAIGARFDYPNGVTNALVLPHAMRFNAEATGDRLALVAEVLEPGASDGTRDVEAAIAAVERLIVDLSVPTRLRDIGVTREALPLLAADAIGDWFLHQNPRPVSGAHELVGILDRAW